MFKNTSFIIVFIIAIITNLIIYVSIDSKERYAKKTLKDVLDNMVQKKYISGYGDISCNINFLTINGDCQISMLELNNKSYFEKIVLGNIQDYNKILTYIRGSDKNIDLKLNAFNFQLNEKEKLASNLEFNLVGNKDNVSLSYNVYNLENASVKGSINGSIFRSQIAENLSTGDLKDIREYIVFDKFNANILYQNDFLFSTIYSLYLNKMNNIDNNQRYEFNYNILRELSHDKIEKAKFKNILLELVKQNIEKNEDLILLLDESNIFIENGLVKTLNDLINLKENNKNIVIKNNTKDNILKLLETKDYKIEIK